jgi:hypothetical protein
MLGRHDPRPYFLNMDASLEDLARRDERYLVKTHELPNEADRFPTVYLIRDGRDALVSYAWHYLQRDRGLLRDAIAPELFSEALRHLIWEPNSAFGTWSRHVEAWLDRAATAPTVLLRFEEFVQRPQVILDAVERIGLDHPRPGAEFPTFESLREMSPFACRRGIIGSWRDEFPPALLDDFWKQHGATMRRFGYE